MLKFYAPDHQRLIEVPQASSVSMGDKIVWIDLCNPTHEEESFVESLTNIDVPTRDDIREIEISNTLYQENGALYTTAALVVHSESDDPEIHRVSFIMTGNVLITIRYTEPKAFILYPSKARLQSGDYSEGRKILVDLLEIIVGRSADSLENTGHLIDDTIQNVFKPGPRAIGSPQPSNTDFRKIMQQIAVCGDLISKVRESAVTTSRLISYIEKTSYFKNNPEDIQRLDVLLTDINSLRDYANFLSDKISFLLNATLGMLGIEQNAIIKIFSVAAVIFLPPTLIASIYGMNFHHMPELAWHLGYPLALAMMAFSAYVPYRFFKKKGWL